MWDEFSSENSGKHHFVLYQFDLRQYQKLEINRLRETTSDESHDISFIVPV